MSSGPWEDLWITQRLISVPFLSAEFSHPFSSIRFFCFCPLTFPFSLLAFTVKQEGLVCFHFKPFLSSSAHSVQRLRLTLNVHHNTFHGPHQSWQVQHKYRCRFHQNILVWPQNCSERRFFLTGLCCPASWLHRKVQKNLNVRAGNSLTVSLIYISCLVSF